jgi:cytochrome c oxidase subunit II
MSRTRFVVLAVFLVTVSACAKKAAPPPADPPAVVIAEPAEPLVEGTAPAPREIPPDAEPSDAKDAMELFVVRSANGAWKVQYPNGQRIVLDGQLEKLTDAERQRVGKLVLAVGRPVKFTVTSEGGAVPLEILRFSVAINAAEGKYAQTTFKPLRAGEFSIRSGSDRIGTALVAPVAEFDAWLQGFGALQGAGNPVDGSPAHSGRQLFLKLQCVRCHSATPDAKGPVLEGLYGTKVALKGGGAEIADDAYIIESIRRPRLKVIEGWEAIMPAYDETQVTAEELNTLVAYIRSLKKGATPDQKEQFPAPVVAPTQRPKEPAQPPREK